MVQTERLLKLSPLRISGGYLAFGVTWILLSDWVVLLVTESQAQYAQLQTIKGWLFVVSSAALLFGLTRTRETHLTASQNRLDRANQQLQVLHRVFRHNIRNDLNVAQGYIKMTLDSIEEDPFRDWLNFAYDSTGRIVDMSAKLRIVEKTDFSPSPAGSVCIVDSIRRELAELVSSYPDVNIETKLPDRARISGGHSWTYVIRELLENAVDHHHLPEDERHISVEVDRSLTTVTIRISDNGPGIPDDELAALRSGEETQLTHMSGVGLWLVKWLCQLSGCEVRFSTGPSEGTTVTLECLAASPIDAFADQTWLENQRSADV